MSETTSQSTRTSRTGDASDANMYDEHDQATAGAEVVPFDRAAHEQDRPRERVSEIIRVNAYVLGGRAW